MANGKAETSGPVMRGAYMVPLPWHNPVVRTAEAGVGFLPGIHRMYSGPYWILLYTHTATRVRVGRVKSSWMSCLPGTAIMVPAYCDYWVDTRGSKNGPPVHHAWLTLQQIDSTPIVAMFQNRTGVVRFVDTGGVLGRQLEALIAVAERARENAFWPMQYALRPLLHSISRATPLECGLFEITARVTTTLTETLVPGVVSYLQGRMAESISTAGLAKHLRLSVSTVSHTYHKLTGETPMQTLRRLRIQQIKSYLVEGWSLDAAAHGVGFYDAHHASREFKRAEGISPSGFLGMVRDSAA
jgi:AraC-like DNA-binding protein